MHLERKEGHTQGNRSTCSELEVGKAQPRPGHLPDDILSPKLLRIQLSAPGSALFSLSEEDRLTHINYSRARQMTYRERFALRRGTKISASFFKI